MHRILLILRRAPHAPEACAWTKNRSLSGRSRIARFFGSLVPNLLERLDPPGGIDTIEHAVVGLAASGYQPDPMTDGIVASIAAQQGSVSNWNFALALARPPVEDSDFLRTALGIRGLKVYGTTGRRVEMDARIEPRNRGCLRRRPPPPRSQFSASWIEVGGRG
jgi:hypothetical protein